MKEQFGKETSLAGLYGGKPDMPGAGGPIIDSFSFLTNGHTSPVGPKTPIGPRTPTGPVGPTTIALSRPKTSKDYNDNYTNNTMIPLPKSQAYFDQIKSKPKRASIPEAPTFCTSSPFLKFVSQNSEPEAELPPSIHPQSSRNSLSSGRQGLRDDTQQRVDHSASNPLFQQQRQRPSQLNLHTEPSPQPTRVSRSLSRTLGSVAIISQIKRRFSQERRRSVSSRAKNGPSPASQSAALSRHGSCRSNIVAGERETRDKDNEQKPLTESVKPRRSGSVHFKEFVEQADGETIIGFCPAPIESRYFNDATASIIRSVSLSKSNTFDNSSSTQQDPEKLSSRLKLNTGISSTQTADQPVHPPQMVSSQSANAGLSYADDQELAKGVIASSEIANWNSSDAKDDSEETKQMTQLLLATRLRNRLCTSFRVNTPGLNGPVDVCLLPNSCFVVADYDQGLIIFSPLGEIFQRIISPYDKKVCGVTCGRAADGPVRIYSLIFRDISWILNVYENYYLVESIRCPTDVQIESWALRKIGFVSEESIYLMACGQSKVTIWLYDVTAKAWRVLATEGGRKEGYSDISMHLDGSANQLSVLLTDWHKSQLCTVKFRPQSLDLIDQQSIKIKRVKGQEWIVSGPSLAAIDEQGDVIVYDGSGKLFLFDGWSHKCKKIIADVGKGEVNRIFARSGWLYALCRYRLCIEAYLYKQISETTI